MWYRIGRIENTIFLIPFLLYAKLRRIPCSTKCEQCGRLLPGWFECWRGLCDQCELKGLSKDTARSYNRRSKYRPRVSVGSEHVTKAITSRIGSGKILDIGCGEGIVLQRLKGQNQELYGIDIAHDTVENARKRIPAASILEAGATSLPFADNTFDYVICSHVLEHIESDDAIKECYRVLKPGATAILVVPNGRGIAGKRPFHVRYFSFNSFKGYTQNAGFELVTGRKFGFYIPIMTQAIELLFLAMNRWDLPFSATLDVNMPEYLATDFLLECRKPN